MRAVGHSSSLQPVPSLCSHTSKAAAIESDSKDVVEFSIDDEMAGKNAAVRDLHTQSCAREEVFVNTFLVEDVKIPLRVISKTQKDKLMEFSGTSKY